MESYKRARDNTVTFRVTSEERRQIEARILVCGIPKAEYYIQSLLHQNIKIIVGKYQSDRLSLEIRRLREKIDGIEDLSNEESQDVLLECRALLKELVYIIENNLSENEILTRDFAQNK